MENSYSSFIDKPHRAKTVLLFLLLATAAGAQTTARLIPKRGLHVTTQQLDWIMGSELNFFTPDKKHHHYFFTWWEQDADSADGNTRLVIGSGNTAVYGDYTLSQKGKDYLTAIDCQWNRPDSAVADIVYAKAWLPFLSGAVWRNSQHEALPSLEQFRDSILYLETPFGQFRFQSDRPFRVRTDADLQPGANNYTRRSQLVLFFDNDVLVTSNTGLHRRFSIGQLDNNIPYTAADQTRHVTPTPVAQAWTPAAAETLLPQPQKTQWGEGAYTIPSLPGHGAGQLVNRFRKMTGISWRETETLYPELTAAPDKTLHAEGYVLDITRNGIRINYGSSAGLDHALRTLACLAYPSDGKLAIRCGHIEDFPSVIWRGIHMFTGPASLALHQRMYDRVLLPLKMNKVVLQCEQAQWSSRPETHNPISVPMKDLEEEFAFLRRNHCEPIPLVQSLGHMEWFFKPKQNRFMAVNPHYPYTLNPELPASRKAITQIWDEVFARLRPSVMHIGFDEIGMIGFNEPKENEIRYWKTQLSYLNAYAKKRRAKLMLWGDMGLAPGEGPDALNGVTKERAALLRSTIPAGSYVADWHYLNDPDPEVYKTSLRIWKKNRNIPLASPWLWPNNVRGFALAAKEEKAGVLQTTWADFESSETNMLKNIEQFGAYVLALDYAWSGREELPGKLPYDPVLEWGTRFYRDPWPLSAKDGWHIPVPEGWRNATRLQDSKGFSSLQLEFAPIDWIGLRIKARTDAILPEATPVAILRFFNGDDLVYETTLRYGAEIRAAGDQRPVYAHCPGKDTRTHYSFLPGNQTNNASSVSITLLHPGAGLHLEELTLIKP